MLQLLSHDRRLAAHCLPDDKISFHNLRDHFKRFVPEIIGFAEEELTTKLRGRCLVTAVDRGHILNRIPVWQRMFRETSFER